MRLTLTKMQRTELEAATSAEKGVRRWRLEDVWRGLKATVAANRCAPSLEELTDRALAWRDAMSDADRLRRGGRQTSTFDWLPT